MQGEAENIADKYTSYKTVRDALPNVLNQMKALDKQGEYTQCYDLLGLAVAMKSDIESRLSNYGPFCDAFKVYKEDGWQDILDDFNSLNNEAADYYKA